MPHVDGFTLAEQIKQDAEMGSTVVMMLTWEIVRRTRRDARNWESPPTS